MAKTLFEQQMPSERVAKTEAISFLFALFIVVINFVSKKLARFVH